MIIWDNKNKNERDIDDYPALPKLETTDLLLSVEIKKIINLIVMEYIGPHRIRLFKKMFKNSNENAQDAIIGEFLAQAFLTRDKKVLNFILEENKIWQDKHVAEFFRTAMNHVKFFNDMPLIDTFMAKNIVDIKDWKSSLIEKSYQLNKESFLHILSMNNINIFSFKYWPYILKSQTMIERFSEKCLKKTILPEKYNSLAKEVSMLAAANLKNDPMISNLAVRDLLIMMIEKYKNNIEFIDTVISSISKSTLQNQEAAKLCGILPNILKINLEKKLPFENKTETIKPKL